MNSARKPTFFTGGMIALFLFICYNIDMFTVTFKLDANKHQIKIFNKRFFVYNKLKNTEIKEAQKLIRLLERDATYLNARKEYVHIKHDLPDNKVNRKRLNELSNIMNQRRKKYGLTNFDLKMFIKPMRKKYAKFISSQQGQSISEEIWKAVEKYLFEDGKSIHLKKINETMSIPQTTNLNGVKFNKDEASIEWLGITVPVRLRHSKYEEECMDKKFRYCYIKREMFNSGWKYYVTLIFEGNPPLKYPSCHKYTLGLDPGTSTFAMVKDNKAILDNLASGADEYAKQIRHLDRLIEHSLRINNPDNYTKDGTIKKKTRHFKPVWNMSNRCKKLKRKRKALFRKQAAYILQSHRQQLNEILKDVSSVTSEEMNFKSLQKRSRKTEKSDKTVLTKSGKEITKYKKKKQFGKSLSLHAPALFVSELKRKCRLLNIEYREVNTRVYKASQFDHTRGECIRCNINDRIKIIDGHVVQRDLYSAFLIKNANPDLESVNIDKCIREFPSFLRHQEQRLNFMKANHISNKACFGF